MPDPTEKSRRTLALYLTAAAASFIIVGYFVDLHLLRQIGFLALPLFVLWLVDILGSEAAHQPRVIIAPTSPWSKLRYRPSKIFTMATGLLILGPPSLAYGLLNGVPEAIAAGVVFPAMLVAAFLLSAPVLLHGGLYFERDRIRISTFLYERTCDWDAIDSISVVESYQGSDAIRISATDAVHTTFRKFGPRRASKKVDSNWDIIAWLWGVKINSLASTVIYLKDHADFRDSPDEIGLRSMLRTPDRHR
ncbi:hypothetical protein ACL02S_15775 [Nocardia sp. 004]|uniref:hypothetical protein n=1 Tax=Nocardia sp. 004 TaxID=3385978 RepID=UPI0039A02933